VELVRNLRDLPRHALTGWILAFTAATGWANYTSWRNTQDTRALARANQETIEHQAATDCLATLRNRDDNEAILIQLATDSGADPETIALIHRTYDNLAPPAGCEGKG